MTCRPVDSSLKKLHVLVKSGIGGRTVLAAVSLHVCRTPRSREEVASPSAQMPQLFIWCSCTLSASVTCSHVYITTRYDEYKEGLQESTRVEQYLTCICRIGLRLTCRGSTTIALSFCGTDHSQVKDCHTNWDSFTAHVGHDDPATMSSCSDQ